MVPSLITLSLLIIPGLLGFTLPILVTSAHQITRRCGFLLSPDFGGED